jgi:hypothetical protein
MGSTVKRIPGNDAGWAGVDMPFARVKEEDAQLAIETFMATIDDTDIHGVGLHAHHSRQPARTGTLAQSLRRTV